MFKTHTRTGKKQFVFKTQTRTGKAMPRKATAKTLQPFKGNIVTYHNKGTLVGPKGNRSNIYKTW